jgi:hypothetical protein
MRLTVIPAVIAAAAILTAASCIRGGAAGNAGKTAPGIIETTGLATGPDSTPVTGSDSAAVTVTSTVTHSGSTTLAGTDPNSPPAAVRTIDSAGNTTGDNTLFGIPLDSYNIVTGKVKRNQFISSILSAQGVEWNDIEKLLRDNRETFDPRRIRTGSSYSVLITKDTLSKADYFIYQHDPRVAYVFSLKDTLAIYRHDAEIKRMLRYSSGTLTLSLWETAMENNLNPNFQPSYPRSSMNHRFLRTAEGRQVKGSMRKSYRRGVGRHHTHTCCTV